jgi:small subunit ribosomal protein S15
MSRIHSGNKGRASSHRPYPASLPSWVALDKDEVTEEAVKLAKAGSSAAQVGMILRDTHGVPSVRLVTGMRLGPLLKEKGVAPQLPEDLAALLRRVVHLQGHLERHPKDLANLRGLNLIEARIRRLARYYRLKKVLPADWHYTAETAALQVE